MNGFILGILILLFLHLSLPYNRNYNNNSEDVTYTKDAQLIFKNRCSQCHNQSVPDRNWMNYDTAFKNRHKIKSRLENNTMPPGNNTGMTSDERKTIIKWVDDGGKK